MLRDAGKGEKKRYPTRVNPTHTHTHAHTHTHTHVRARAYLKKIRRAGTHRRSGGGREVELQGQKKKGMASVNEKGNEGGGGV